MTANGRLLESVAERFNGRWLPRGLPTLAVDLPGSGATAYLIDAGGFVHVSSADATPLEIAAALGIDRAVIQSDASEQDVHLRMQRMLRADAGDPLVRELLRLRGITAAQLAVWTLADTGTSPSEWGWISAHLGIDSEREAA